MPLINKLSNKSKEMLKQKGPVWLGPEVDGVTFSLLSRFLVCRERFRLLAIEGIAPVEKFNHRLEFGNMWHVCEENENWHGPLEQYVVGLCKKFPMDREEIRHWYDKCRTQFPLYLEYWSRHPDVLGRTVICPEKVFNVSYKLPSNRIVKLRGKWDSVDVIEDQNGKGILLQENKTKSGIDQEEISNQLTYDFQTMIYLTALKYSGEFTGRGQPPIQGVRYNVVRRSSHYQGKRETAEGFQERLKGLIEEKSEEFFARWKVKITEADIHSFRIMTLDPILEQLCHWYDHMVNPSAPVPNLPKWAIHYRTPYGIYNPMLEGGTTELDHFMRTGSMVGLTRTNNLFPELT